MPLGKLRAAVRVPCVVARAIGVFQREAYTEAFAGGEVEDVLDVAGLWVWCPIVFEVWSQTGVF